MRNSSIARTVTRVGMRSIQFALKHIHSQGKPLLDLLKTCHKQQGADAETLSDNILDLMDQGAALMTGPSYFGRATTINFDELNAAFLERLENLHEEEETELEAALPWIPKVGKRAAQREAKRRRAAKCAAKPAKPAAKPGPAAPAANIANSIKERRESRRKSAHLCHTIASHFCTSSGQHVQVVARTHLHFNCKRPHVRTFTLANQATVHNRSTLSSQKGTRYRQLNHETPRSNMWAAVAGFDTFV